MVIYTYIAPGQGQTTSWVKLFFENINLLSLVICYKVFPLNNFLTLFPIQTHRRPNLTLSLNWPAQPSVIIYIHFVELESSMFHAKFQDILISGSDLIWTWWPS